MEETAGTARTAPPGAGDTAGGPDRSDLLHVALAAYAAHLEKQARVRAPGATTPWGRSARIASLRRFTR